MVTPSRRGGAVFGQRDAGTFRAHHRPEQFGRRVGGLALLRFLVAGHRQGFVPRPQSPRLRIVRASIWKPKPSRRLLDKVICGWNSRVGNDATYVAG